MSKNEPLNGKTKFAAVFANDAASRAEELWDALSRIASWRDINVAPLRLQGATLPDIAQVVSTLRKDIINGVVKVEIATTSGKRDFFEGNAEHGKLIHLASYPHGDSLDMAKRLVWLYVDNSLHVSGLVQGSPRNSPHSSPANL
jgi:hypothetical protein